MASRLRSFAQNVAVLAGTLVVLVLSGEIAVRIAKPGQSQNPELSGQHQYDSLLGWRNTPSAVVRVHTREYAIEERFNALGLRGRERTLAKPAGTRRILLIGDSFVEGYTVSQDEVVSARLEGLLRASAQPVEVLNAGTAGYSTDQEVLWYESRGRALGADVVVLFFYVNDVWFNIRDRYWRGHKPMFRMGGPALVLTGVPVPPPEGAYAFGVPGGHGLARLVRRADAALGRYSALYRWLRGLITQSDAGTALLIRTGFGAVPDELRPWHTVPDASADSAWQVTEALLERMRGDVERGGARFVVFHVPARPAVDDADWQRTRARYVFDETWSPRAETARLKDICRRHRFDCLFPEEQYRGAVSGGPLYFRGDAHWTAAGHALAAAVVAGHLARPPAAPAAPASRPR